MEISGKNIIVTGAASGLGRHYAVDLKNLGAKVFAIDIVTENLDALRQETGIRGRVVNVSEEHEVVKFFEEFTAEYGAPHVLINNAGVTADALLIKKKGDELIKFPFSNWQKTITINMNGVFLCTREAAYHMIMHHVKGVIVNISSVSRAGNAGQTNYSASKAAVDAMTVTWAKELARYGIRVGAIAPGYINTEMVARIKPEMREKIVSSIPLGRLGEMEEISRFVQAVITNDYFTGRIIEVDGGLRL